MLTKLAMSTKASLFGFGSVGILCSARLGVEQAPYPSIWEVALGVRAEALRT